MWSPLRSLDAAYSPRPFQATTRCHSVLECHSSSAPFQDAESPAKEPHTCGLTPSQTCAPGFCRDNGLISRFRIDAVYYCSGEHSASEVPHKNPVTRPIWGPTGLQNLSILRVFRVSHCCKGNRINGS